jgi:hypothetical protein
MIAKDLHSNLKLLYIFLAAQVVTVETRQHEHNPEYTPSFTSVAYSVPYIKRAIQQPALKIQPDSTTSLWFLSSHTPATSSPASENPEAADFIRRWIRSIESDSSPYTLSPRSPVDCRLDDEATISTKYPRIRTSQHHDQWSILRIRGVECDEGNAQHRKLYFFLD